MKINSLWGGRAEIERARISDEASLSCLYHVYSSGINISSLTFPLFLLSATFIPEIAFLIYYSNNTKGFSCQLLLEQVRRRWTPPSMSVVWPIYCGIQEVSNLRFSGPNTSKYLIYCSLVISIRYIRSDWWWKGYSPTFCGGQDYSPYSLRFSYILHYPKNNGLALCIMQLFYPRISR